MAVFANVALTNTFDTWRTRTNQLVTRINQFAINESALYANTLTANVSFTSKGLATLQGRATVGTNLTVSGNTTLGAAGKNVNATGWFGVNGRQSISTNLYVAGNTTTSKAVVSKLLTVSGNTVLGGAGKTVNATGWFGVNGRATIGTNLFVAGNTTIGGDININGAINLGNASTDLLTVTGRATIGTNLTVSGNTTIGGLTTMSGRATVGTNLTVSGNTTLNGTTTDKSNALSQTLTDASTIAWDTSLGRVATVTLGASRTMGAPTNLKVGTYILKVVQGGSGSYNITWNGLFKWTAQTAPTLSTAVGATDIFSFFSDGSKLYGSFIPDVR